MANTKRLLIVDDSEIDRTILSNILSKCFEVLEAENGYAALELITKNKVKIDGVLLDISMPVLNGFDVLSVLCENHVDIPIVLVTAEATADNVRRAAKFDVAGFISKPFNSQVILEKLGSIFEIDRAPASLKIREENLRKTKAYEVDDYISKLSLIYRSYLRNIGLDDSHCCRVSMLMEILLLEYSRFHDTDLDQADIKMVSKAAYFYDIGLMGFPKELAVNLDTAAKTNYQLYVTHTTMGADIVSLNNSDYCKAFVEVCSDICMHHHERFDGLGFPHGLRGEDTSVYTQLCGLAIRFDKFFIRRKKYNDIQFDFIINELKIDGGAFAPELINLLSACKGQIIDYYKTWK